MLPSSPKPTPWDDEPSMEKDLKSILATLHYV